MMAGLALVPTVDEVRSLVRLQSVLSQHVRLAPVLGHPANMPHLTLVQGEFGDRVNFELILHTLREHHSAERFDRLKYDSIVIKEPSWLFLLTSRIAGLRGLHDRAFELSKPHLKPPPLQERKPDYSEPEWARYVEWGYRYIGDSFLPHVTLGKMTSPREPLTGPILGNAFADFVARGNTFTPAAITAYRAGEFGSYAETLAWLAL